MTLQVQSSVLQKELSVATADRTSSNLELWSVGHPSACAPADRDLLDPLSVNLVNKDQIDVLRSLRASVNEDKAQLEKEAQDLKDKLRESNEKERLQMEQING